MQQQPSTLTEQQVKDGCMAMIYMVIVVPLDAFMVWLLWGFFIVPLGAHPISFWLAAGLSIFASYMLQTAALAKEPPNPQKAFLNHIGITILVLAMSIGYRLMMGI